MQKKIVIDAEVLQLLLVGNLRLQMMDELSHDTIKSFMDQDKEISTMIHKFSESINLFENQLKKFEKKMRLEKRREGRRKSEK